MQSKDSKEIQIRRVTGHILELIRKSFEAHRKRVEKMNDQKSFPRGFSKNQAISTFSSLLNSVSQQLKTLIEEMGTSKKLKKERRRLYETKINELVRSLEQIRGNKHSLKIKINEALFKMISETSKIVGEAKNALKNFEKEGGGFCCGGNSDYKSMLERTMTELCSRVYLWSSITKFESVTSDSVKEIYLANEYNEEEFKIIEKQVRNSWPNPEVKVEIIQKQIIVPKVEIQQNSQLREAIQMLFGFTQPQNLQKALEIYKSEERKNKCHHKVYLALGQLYEQGKYLSKDLNKAVSYFKKCAELNDAEGLYKIGMYLEKGFINSKYHFDGMYPNRLAQIRGGIQYYEKAAKLGHLDAITDLGYIYERGIQNEDGNGFFIEPHPNHALKYYQKAKKSEFPRAYNNLGNLYITCSQLNEEVEGGNLSKGIKYLEKAIESKYPKAFLNLGKCYQNGVGVLQSIDRARSLYLEGAQLGDMMCKLEYVKSCFGYRINDENTLIKMVELTRQILADDSRNPEALYYMGLFFEQGIAVEHNKESSFYYIQLAARFDYAAAITKLGDYYYSGYFVQKDLVYAKALYEKAAQMNEPKAITNLGVLAEKGIGMQNDPRRAQNLYERAAQLGNPNAIIFLSETNKQNFDSNEAITEAAGMGSMTAMRLVKNSNIMVPKKKKEVHDYTQTLKNLQSHYLKSGLRTTGNLK